MPLEQLTCATVAQYLNGVSLVKQCDIISNNMIRIATPFQHSNGSSIDFFLKSDTGLFDSWDLTDMGETTAYLLDMHVKIWTTEKRKQAVKDICEMLEIQHSGGQFAIHLSRLEDLPSAMIRLSQACIRISDLAITHRFRSVSAFKEDVQEFFDENDLAYKTNVIFTGRHDNQVTIDFEVAGNKMKSLILTLSTPNAATAAPLSKEVFTKWYDIEHLRSSYQFITLFDATNNIIHAEDLARLEDYSTAIGFPPEQERIMLALAA